MNKDWLRWIVVSIQKHFDNNKGDLNLHIEGSWRGDENTTSFIELRIDGPIFKELSKDYWEVKVIVNILVNVARTDTDYHEKYKDTGEVVKILTDIVVKKYGDGETTLGCLTRVDPIDVGYIGQITETSPVERYTVEAVYKMNLESN